MRIATYLPREGPETLEGSNPHWHGRSVSIDTYLPREGTVS